MRTRSRGFTLIELMITVAIIGILSSIAIPNFIKYQLRSRASERAVLSKAIQTAMTELWIREGRYPNDLGGGTSFIFCPQNPPGPPKTAKRQFRADLGDWGKFSVPFEGGLYYSYEVIGLAGAGGRWYVALSQGDLDGDGDVSWVIRNYTYVGEGLASFTETPAGGEF
jgi:prepilin-type N-terminal cleavage/methylation domain-containing protein